MASEVRAPRSKPKITVLTRPSVELAERLWDIYVEEFGPYRERALLDHVYSRAAFLDLLHDPSVYKIVARTEDGPVGLMLLTPNLEIVPQISPAFLRRRYPDHAARDAIFYGILSFVAPSHRATTVYARVLAAGAYLAAKKSGVVIYDVCSYAQQQGIHEYPARIAGWFEDSSFETIDVQTYFATSFPSPQSRISFNDVEIDLTEGEQRELEGTPRQRDAAAVTPEPR